MSWLAVAPSPFRGWIRWRPRDWPAPPRPWFDVATRRIGWPDEGSPPTAPLPDDLPRRPGLVALPPLAAARRAEREAMRERLAAASCTVVDFVLAADGVAAGAGRFAWVDPLDAWLAGTDTDDWIRAVAAATEGAELAIAVPLVAGVTPEGDALALWLDRFATLAPVAVLGVVAELSPYERRRLVEARGEGSFDAVFHGRPLPEHDFALAVASRGLRTLPRRQLLATLPPRLTRNLELAGALWETAELALRLRSSEAECAGLFAAARRVEATPHDLAALAREGNLGVLDWPSPAAREVVEQLLARGAADRLDALRRQWARGGDG
ncbi:MAG: hypothetical protein NDJ75_00975 [Thermoanaerobaculia bacterium]|nr:hypothetical protein [Thermoanaerobaculia bacterium]